MLSTNAFRLDKVHPIRVHFIVSSLFNRTFILDRHPSTYLCELAATHDASLSTTFLTLRKTTATMMMKFLSPVALSLTLFTVAEAFRPTIALQSTKKDRSMRREMFQKLLESKVEGIDQDRRLDFVAEIWGEIDKFLPDMEDLNNLFPGWEEDEDEDTDFDEEGDREIMIPDDALSAMPSDMPSMMPSDMPSMMPSDMPSMTPNEWEETGKEIATDPPPGGDDTDADSVIGMPGTSEEARSAPGASDDGSHALAYALGFGVAFVALVVAFVVYRIRRSPDSDAFLESGEDTPLSNTIALEEGVTPRTPSPVNANNQFDGPFADDHEPSASMVSHSASAEISNYQMSDIGRVDSNRSSLLGTSTNPQASHTYQMSEIGPADSNRSNSLGADPQVSNTVTL